MFMMGPEVTGLETSFFFGVIAVVEGTCGYPDKRRRCTSQIPKRQGYIRIGVKMMVFGAVCKSR